MPATSRIELAREGPVATVRFHNPSARNAMSAGMADEFVAVCRELASDDSVRTVVLTGDERAFCAGAELDGVEPAGDFLPVMRGLNEVPRALRALPQPVVAKVSGVAAGAGMSLALGCDLVVASTSARFVPAFPAIGLSPDFGGSWLLSRRVGSHRAAEIWLLGEELGAGDLERLGLANHVVAPGELDATVARLAARLAGLAPRAAARTKALLRAASAVTFDEALDLEAEAQALNIAEPAFAAARERFLATRSAKDRT